MTKSHFFMQTCEFKVILIPYDNLHLSSNIRAHVLLNLSNSLRKSYKMLDKPRIYSFSSTRSINSIITGHI